MTTYPAIRDPNRCPSHPGAVLADMLQDLDITKADVAKLLSISRQHLHDILAERKPVSPTVAARLAKAFGGGIAVWLHLQADYDAWHAEREIDTSDIPTYRAA
ncbi:HigA family addiction module antitoxin [Phyllobacterium leguminum]|uniref:Addiction module HigA family antidote n=1 Tax=Phyllobacterium leguminum TaxID=314237 RepID=A0A318THY1_9HYPH|nr:HigA family addiction module antitoxin [Phyllobacterium leguminum]PYE88518.1 addiction module HigA family antidote [Phyllobacterium leguminum]